MGALCGKESTSDDPFAQPGRTVGSAPPPQTRASVPKVSGQGQTLGGRSTGGGAAESDARSAAAKAAEVGHTEFETELDTNERAKKNNQPKGKLGRDLAAQKSKTRTGTLADASAEVRNKRTAGATDELISYE